MPINKKILICTGIYPPDIGGPATYSKMLFEELPKIGMEAEILSFGAVRRLPKIIRHFSFFLKALKMAKKADIIFAQDPVSVGLPSYLAAKFAGKKFILKIVGDYAWEQSQQKENFITLEEFQKRKFDFKTELRRKIQKFVAKRADKVIVPSEYLKKTVLAWKIKEFKIKVIYNAFDFSEIIESKEEIRKKLNLSGTVIISSGRLVPWKGFGALVEIIPELVKKIPDINLVIIGDGPESPNLKSQISNLGLDDKIILTGQLPHRDLLHYLTAGDIFVLNTGYEGFSHLILEAMAMGIPIIATSVGGNPELIEDGKSGALTKYGDNEQLKEKIFNLYNDKATSFYFSENAKKKVKNFSKEKMLEETTGLFNAL